MTICLAVGAIVFYASVATMGLVEKTWRDGWWEAGRGALHALQNLTAIDILRLIGFSAVLSLIACFPVYASSIAARPPAMIAAASLAGLSLASYFSFEAWYWYGHRTFPPFGFVLTLAAAALASAYASRIVLALRARKETP